MPRNIERDKREADRRKNQLIEAGFRLFSQNGIETVSLQKVADAANVSPATIGTQKTLALVDRLGSSVPLYRLGCNMEPEAALVAYHGMNYE